MSLPTNFAAYRLPVAAVVLVGLLAWEMARPFLPLFAATANPGRARGRHGLGNLGLGLVNGLLGAGLFVGLWAGVTSWTAGRGFGLLNLLGQHSVWRWPLALLVLDAWTYTWHRLNHRLPFLWRFHRLHHSDQQMDVTTATRFHVVEIAFSSLLRLPLLALLGARLDELAIYETLLFAVVQFHHANIGLPEHLDRVLRWVIVTPALHKVHHSVRRSEADSNFSSLFSWWDRLFGTWLLLPGDRPIQFGVED